MTVDVRSLSDAELERLAAEGDTPPPPDHLPETKGINEKKGSTAITPTSGGMLEGPGADFLQGAAHHAFGTALSLGELLRSTPVAGDLLKKAGDLLASGIFGNEAAGTDTGANGSPSPMGMFGRIQDERSALNTVVPPPPDNTASRAGAVTSAMGEAAATLPVSSALAVPEASGFMLNAGRALLAGGREAALAGGTTALQEGGTQNVGTSAALAGAIPVAGAAAGGMGNVLSHHLANTLVATPSEAVLAGADAARGLQDSKAVAGGAGTLMLKVKDYARRAANELDSFVLKHANGSKPMIDRTKLLDSINEDMAHFQMSQGATSDVFGGASSGEKKAIIESLRKLKNTISKGDTGGEILTEGAPRFISPREALKIRREIDQMTSFGEAAQKTTASSALNESRQKLRTILNDEINASVPGAEPLLKKSYEAMLALEGVRKLVDSPGLGKESFLVRRGLPLAASALGGAGLGYIGGGGSPGTALAGLGAGAAMGMPAVATPLIQLLRNSPESSKAAEILARVFGILPQGKDQTQDPNAPVQGGPR